MEKRNILIYKYLLCARPPGKSFRGGNKLQEVRSSLGICSPYWTQKYWERFPSEAQGTLVPAGASAPPLYDIALLWSLYLTLYVARFVGGIYLTTVEMSTCSDSHPSLYLQPMESNRHFSI